jgi:hypothetical protein
MKPKSFQDIVFYIERLFSLSGVVEKVTKVNLKLMWDKLLDRNCRGCYYFPDYFGNHCYKHKKDILNPKKAICRYFIGKKDILGGD